MLALIFLSAACQSKKQEDSSEIAEEYNDEVIDDRTEEKDADFVVHTIAGNYAEIKLAQLALTKSKDERVKDVARMLETDHTKVMGELKAYANKNGISFPIEEDEDAKKDYNKLLEETDVNAFDEKWADMLKDKHEKTINKFESRLDKTEDPELKTWIVATLPALKNHLKMLENSKERLN